MTRIWFVFVSCLFALGLASCKENPPADPTGDAFDKAEMLANIADVVIIPSYAQAVTAAEDLQSTWQAFTSNPTEGSLSAVRQSFSELYLAWQGCAPVEMGPAGGVSLKWLINTYPADTTRIKALISEGNAELTAAQNSAAKGLPALDFVLSTFSLLQLAESNTSDYVTSNISLITKELSEVYAEWQNTYRDEFVSSTGSDVGSSLGQLVNAINQDYELVKNAKVGIPLGKKTLGLIQPEKVEALYSKASLELIKANVEAIRTIFTGADGLGLDDQLDALDARYGQSLLSTAILDGFNEVLSAHAAIEGDLDEAITNGPSAVESLHTKLQNLVVLLKTDMPSQLGVQITYQDNDGD